MQQRSQNELAVITKAKELCKYVMTVTQKSPKAYRFTFVTRMQNLALDVVEYTLRANDTYVAKGDTEAFALRSDLQHQALTSVKLLSYMAMLAMEQGCILVKQYEQIGRLGTDCTNMLGAWLTSDKKRFASG